MSTWLRWLEDRLHGVGAVLVFLVTQVVYLKTMTVSCPFWDSGEFIATSYILGIPHPPGTPLYVLIGRVFSLLPIFPLIATRVNWLSALASSLAAVFTYLIAVELWRRCRKGSVTESRAGSGSGGSGSGSVSGSASSAGGGEFGEGSPRFGGEERGDRWIGFFAGLVAALFTAFSRTFWDNSIEAEVYSLSSLIMAMAIWLILRWARLDTGGNGRSMSHQAKNGLFILLYYLLCLSMGIHLGTFLVLPGIVLFVLLEDRRTFGGTALGAWFVAGLVVLLHPGMLPTLGMKIWIPLVVLVALAPLFVGKKWPVAGLRGILFWCLIAAILGMSTHFYLMIRAGHHNPAINEADPESWSALWKVLTRDQYKPPNPFAVRQASWSVQLTTHFWDYARDQYSLGLRPSWLGWYVPYLIGLAGVIGHFRREKKSFALMAVNYLIMSIGLVFYLNFKADEVRPRDYFFVASFQFFAVWIGLGAAVLLTFLRDALSVREGAGERKAEAGQAHSRPAAAGLAAMRPVVGLGVVLALLPFLTAKHFWFEHDRTGFYVARDFAYNMLKPLKPNAILFTNGDNDTFPLWYLQEVEKIRKDVRVANLSLLNTDWYIRQLRDQEPKVDFGWTNDEIDAVIAFQSYYGAMRLGYIDKDEYNRFMKQTGFEKYIKGRDGSLLSKDIAVPRIVEREYGKRPIYVAMTVPDLMGLDNRLVQQGIVYEVQDPGSTPERVDLETSLYNVEHVYRYTNLLLPNGKHDDSVYLDENASRLVTNYGHACIAVAEELRAQDRWDDAERILDKGMALASTSAYVRYSKALLLMDRKRFGAAESLLLDLEKDGVRDARLYRFLGRAQEAQERYQDAEQSYRQALAVSPGAFDAVRELFFLLWDSKKDRQAALQVLDSWLQDHPDDSRVRDVRRMYADSAALLSQRPPGRGAQQEKP